SGCTIPCRCASCAWHGWSAPSCCSSRMGAARCTGCCGRCCRGWTNWPGAPSSTGGSRSIPRRSEAVAPGSTLPQGLNARQREAVLYLDGPCVVLAGAGSGKTRVITQKIAYLLRECGYQARHVVELTFTNKAAREMNERVKLLVDSKLAKGLTVSTFHSLGSRSLREEAAHAGLKTGFSILDSNDALAIIQELLATTDKARLRAVQQSISLWKNGLL